MLLSIVTGWCHACHDDGSTRPTPTRRSSRSSTSASSGPRRRRSPARHQRALQPRRMADDRVPDAATASCSAAARSCRRPDGVGAGARSPTPSRARGDRRDRRAARPSRRRPARRVRAGASGRRTRRARSSRPSTRARRLRRGAEVSARRAGPARARSCYQDDADDRTLQHRRRHARRDGLERALRRRRRRLLPLRADARLAAAAVEKLLEVNAGAARPVRRGRRTCWRRALHANGPPTCSRYVQTWLADPVDGGWCGLAAGRPRLLRRGSTERGARPRRRSTARCIADSNGAMVSAALHAAHAFDDDGPRRDFAVKSLERVLLRLLPARRRASRTTSTARPRPRPARRSVRRWRPRASTPTRPPATSSTR